MYEGIITRVVVDRGFGFIASQDRPDTFFHCTQLADDLVFGEQLQERRVHFEIVEGEKGPRAVNVRTAE